MSGFDLSTKLWLSVMHYPSVRLSKFGQVEHEPVRGPLKQSLESLILVINL